jgi:hypothetical protein
LVYTLNIMPFCHLRSTRGVSEGIETESSR